MILRPKLNNYWKIIEWRNKKIWKSNKVIGLWLIKLRIIIRGSWRMCRDSLRGLGIWVLKRIFRRRRKWRRGLILTSRKKINKSVSGKQSTRCWKSNLNSTRPWRTRRKKKYNHTTETTRNTKQKIKCLRCETKWWKSQQTNT